MGLTQTGGRGGVFIKPTSKQNHSQLQYFALVTRQDGVSGGQTVAGCDDAVVVSGHCYYGAAIVVISEGTGTAHRGLIEIKDSGDLGSAESLVPHASFTHGDHDACCFTDAPAEGTGASCGAPSDDIFTSYSTEPSLRQVTPAMPSVGGISKV
jgi:hypothetical protein